MSPLASKHLVLKPNEFSDPGLGLWRAVKIKPRHIEHKINFNVTVTNKIKSTNNLKDSL